MADTIQAGHVELQLLADIEAGKVTDDEHAVPQLDLGDGETADVSQAVWLMYREPRRWVHQLEGERLWRLTYRGRDVMQGRTDA